jgi:hypothetical protein
MGIFDSTKSTKNTTTNYNDQSNQAIQAGGAAQLVRIQGDGASAGGNINYNITDQGALKAAESIALAGLDTANFSTSAALEKVSATTGKAIDAVERSYQGETQNLFKYGALAVVALTALLVFKGR